VRPEFYTSATDFLNKAKEFNDEIKLQDANAKTAIYYNTHPGDSPNTEIENYANPYWDAISFHHYDGHGSTFNAAMKDANTVLDGLQAYWDGYVAESWNTVPFVLTEGGPDIGGGLGDSQFTGVFDAESVLRASKYPNTDIMGYHRIYGGLVEAGNSQTEALEDVFQDGQTADTSTWDFDMYNSAPSVDLMAADNAINASSAIWTTTVTGGATVDKNSGTMPAIYAQAYKGDDGKNYVVITNKSATDHDVTIKQDGTAVSASMTKTYAANSNPQVKNTSGSPNNVTLQTAATGNPVLVPGYSVVRVEWNARTATVLPTRLTYAKATASGAVTLKWWPLDGVSNYTICYGTTSGSCANTVAANGVTEKAVSGLTNGSTYYFIVYPGSSSTVLSNELSVSLTAPTAPAITQVYPKRSGEIGVEWKSVPGAVGYKVKYGTVSGTYTQTVDAGNVLGYKLTQLTDSTTYYVVVTAYNGIGESSKSSEKSNAPKPNYAYAPNNLRVTSSSSSSVSLSWDPSYAETIYDGFEDGSKTDTTRSNSNDLDDVWTDRSGSFSIVTHPDKPNAKVLEAGSSGEQISTTGSSSWGNYEVETIVDLDATDWSGFAGVVARYDATTGDHYRLIASTADCSGSNDPNDDNKYIKIQKIINGSPTGDLLCSSDPVTSDRFTLRLKVDGSTLTAMVGDDVVESPITDSTLSQGYPGVISKNQPSMFDQFIVRKSNIVSGKIQVYRSSAIFPGPGTLIATIGGAQTSYTDNTSGLASGTYYYRLRGANGANDADISHDDSNIVPYTKP
jgi:hypothetical protein